MVRVQDCNGNEIKVGSVVIFGAPNPDEIEAQTAKVTAISDPDVLYNPVTDADDGGYALVVTIEFPDGETSDIQVNFTSSDEDGELFEDAGDLEVVTHG